MPRLDTPFVTGLELGSPFERGPEERPLRLIVDTLGLGQTDEAVRLLLRLGDQELVELTTTTSDTGFPSLRFGNEIDGDDSMTVWIDYPGTDDVGMTGCYGVSWRLESAEEDARVRGLNPVETRRRYLLAGAACGDVDALVLADPHLLGNAGDLVNAMTPRQALALLGLYLRSRDCYETVALVGPNRHLAIRTTTGTQFRRAAPASLPAAVRWSRACSRAGETPEGEEIAAVAGAIMQRLPRCLRARDEVLRQSLLPATKCDRDVLLYHLDAMLLMLNGMFDATAQVVNVAYAMGEHPIRVSWRNERRLATKPLGWRDRLAKHAPALFTLTCPGTPARQVIEVIALIRNTIHGEPLRGTRVSGGGESLHLVRVPAKVAPNLKREIIQFGGLDYWGVRPDFRHNDGLLLDPLRFAQVLLPLAASALNAIMATTDIERLPGDHTRRWPPSSTPWYEPEHTRAICHLVGLGPW